MECLVIILISGVTPFSVLMHMLEYNKLEIDMSESDAQVEGVWNKILVFKGVPCIRLIVAGHRNRLGSIREITQLGMDHTNIWARVIGFRTCAYDGILVRTFSSLRFRPTSLVAGNRRIQTILPFRVL